MREYKQFVDQCSYWLKLQSREHEADICALNVELSETHNHIVQRHTAVL